MTSGAVVAAVPCPRCGAGRGEKCRGVGGVHPKRRGKAEALCGWAEDRPIPHDRAERHRWRESRYHRR